MQGDCLNPYTISLVPHLIFKVKAAQNQVRTSYEYTIFSIRPVNTDLGFSKKGFIPRTHFFVQMSQIHVTLSTDLIHLIPKIVSSSLHPQQQFLSLARACAAKLG